MIDRPPPRILAIAGSDSSGGAGIQADIKTITMLGGYAMSAVTAVTAQNSVGVQAIAPLSPDMVAEQIASCVSDIGVDAIKIGMLHDVGIVEVVDAALAEQDAALPVILDPVMISTSGANLIAPDAAAAIRDKLFSRAMLITPNLPELARISGMDLDDSGAMIDAATELADRYGCSVLAKGGHTDDARVIDILIRPGGRAVQFDHARIDTPHTHGTGCTLSSAIATLVGHGQALEHAVRLARKFVHSAIEKAPGFGAGNGPLGHQAVRN
ncbi:bifunctional hydroxymethylpyrimidine kinase/phosphomethylpyrimidine kinase [Tsuneonella mangrovi]|uniref:bifunctional hydroxymethylpyrimidine kinase/phosphomethylpyrimidine kinase n=1 Tax=Tsuneonella mangrovi TaxID=1982042 RepID=UPI000BA26A12|nr:bifunctional hydroxymethylpyrimidine kinase/phosphomethylpyrimidine kinase [Tsuneonella mangrovi]